MYSTLRCACDRVWTNLDCLHGRTPRSRRYGDREQIGLADESDEAGPARCRRQFATRFTDRRLITTADICNQQQVVTDADLRYGPRCNAGKIVAWPGACSCISRLIQRHGGKVRRLCQEPNANWTPQSDVRAPPSTANGGVRLPPL